MCGSFPTFAWVELTPWFCPNDNCEVLAWDPYSSAHENFADMGVLVEIPNPEP